MPTSTRAFSIWHATLLALALTACGGAAVAATPVVENEPPPPTPVHARGDSEVTATIGRAGGSLELGNGFRIEIPEGALEADTDFRFTNGHPANVFHPEEGEVGVGEVVELTPFVAAASGHRFRVSAPAARAPRGFEEAEVTLGMEEEGRGRAFGDAVVTRWQYHGASADASRYVADVAFFGGHRLQFGLLREE